MGRKKKASKTLDKANTRIAAIVSIDPALDLGSGNTVSSYQDVINGCSKTLGTYNTLLSQVDEAYNNFLANEKALKDKSEAMLIGVAAKFGKNSNEYEKAGGVRKSEKKKPVKKPKKV